MDRKTSEGRETTKLAVSLSHCLMHLIRTEAGKREPVPRHQGGASDRPPKKGSEVDATCFDFTAQRDPIRRRHKVHSG